MIKIIDFNVSKLIDLPEESSELKFENDESKAKPINSEIIDPSLHSKFKYSLFTKTGTPLYTAPEIL